MTTGSITQVQNGCLRSFGAVFGSCEGGRRFVATSTAVRTVAAGELDQLYQRWRTFQQPVCVCSSPLSIQLGWTASGPLKSRWAGSGKKDGGIIFKCLTTRAVHLDLLTAIDTDAFLMALRRFIARRGTPAELFSDQGTNFKGGESSKRPLLRSLLPYRSTLHHRRSPSTLTPQQRPTSGGVGDTLR